MPEENGEKATVAGEDADGYFQQYWRHASVVRQSFFAYGVGGAALFITKPEVFNKLSSTLCYWIIILFLAGATMQILLALINKYLMLFIYRGKQNTAFCKNLSYRISDKMSDYAQLDLVLDVLTLVAFAFATVLLIAGKAAAGP